MTIPYSTEIGCSDLSNILVTGGTGSIGSALVESLREENEVCVGSHDEHKLISFVLHNRGVSVALADVRDRDAVTRMVQGRDVVIHCAAMKHVPACEQYPLEAVKTNILGTLNVFQASAEAGVETCLFMSTDKASEPQSVMGMTKYLTEREIKTLVPAFPNTRFLIVRNVNVLGSRGSVLDIWEEQISQGKPITVTDSQMTRFVMNMRDAISLTKAALEHGRSGETFIPLPVSVRIAVLARAFALVNSADPEVRLIGIRPGEVLHESLFSAREASGVTALADLPYFVMGRDNPNFRGDPPRSDNLDFLMGIDEAEAFLRNL